jgi:hypothetical protein
MMQLAVSHTPSSSNNLLASDEVLGDDTLCHVSCPFCIAAAAAAQWRT